MKRCLSFMFLAAFLVFHLSTHCIVATAESVTSNDYDLLFSFSREVTPESQKEYALSLYQAYLDDSYTFLVALSKESEETVLSVVFNLVSNLSVEEIYELKTFVVSLDSTSTFSSIVSVLNEQIGVREYASILSPYSSTETASDWGYSPAILQNFIKLNTENCTFDNDDDFNHIMASAFDSNPFAFATMMLSFDDNVIENIANCISTDYVKFNRTAPSAIAYSLNDSVQEIVDLIISRINEKTLPVPSVQYDSYSPDISLFSTVTPTIGTMSYTTAPLTVGTTEKLNVTFTETTNVGSLRQWYVEVYQVVGSNTSLKTAQTVSLSP